MSHSTRAEPSPGDGAPIDPGTFARGLGISLRHLAEYANVAPETPMLRPADARLQRSCATRAACSSEPRDWAADASPRATGSGTCRYPRSPAAPPRS